MALKQLYEAETDIPAALHEHYVEKDGKWVVELDPPAEDVSGLKNALNDERRLRRDADKQLTEIRVKFEGIEPEEVVKLRERVKGLDDADIYDKQGIEALVLRRTESMKADHERVVGTKDREITQLKTSVADLDRRWRQDRIRTAILDAATKAGVAKGAMRDAVSRGLEVFLDLDEQGNVVARDSKGDIRYGKDGINALTPDEWILSLKPDPDSQHLWPPSSGGGAPPHHGGNGQGIDWSKITDPAERLTRYREVQTRSGG